MFLATTIVEKGFMCCLFKIFLFRDTVSYRCPPWCVVLDLTRLGSVCPQLEIELSLKGFPMGTGSLGTRHTLVQGLW